MKYLIIDVETSGIFDFKRPADAEGQPRLASLAMIFLGETLAIELERTFLIKPDGWVMPAEAEAVNGLSTEHLTAHGVPVRDALDAYTAAIESGHVLVGFNIQFDAKMMRGELRRAGMDDLFERTPNICVMRALTGVCKLPKANGKGYKFPKLAEAMSHFKIPQDGAHTAMGDARSCLALFRKAMEIGVCPEPEVHYAKPGTAAGEAAGFGPSDVRSRKAKPDRAMESPMPLADQDIPE